MIPQDGRAGKIQLQHPVFVDMIEPSGALSVDKRSHACFYYTFCAMRARGLTGKGPESQQILYKVGETPPEWMESRDEEIARSIAMLYGLESPDEFLKDEFKKRAWTQAKILGMPVNEAIYRVRPGAPKLT